MKKNAFTLVELLGVMVILGAMLLVTVPSITKTLKQKDEDEYERFLNDIYLATESYIGMRTKEYSELVYNNKAVVELQELISSGYLSENKMNPKTNEVINPLETVLVTRNNDGTYEYALSGKENGISSYIKDGLYFWYDGKKHGSEEYIWNDLSGNGYHGILKGFSNNSEKLWKDNGLIFDGVDDITVVGEINPTSFFTLEITIELLSEVVGNPHIIGNWESGGYGIGMSEGNSLWCNVFPVGATNYSMLEVTGYNEVNTIKHIVSRYDGSKLSLWINGVQVSFMDVTGEIKSPLISTVLALGGNPRVGQLHAYPANVKFYSAKMYDRALSEEEIVNNYEIEKMRFGI